MHIGLSELVIIVLFVVAFFSPEQLKALAAKLGDTLKVYRESVSTLSEPVNEVKQTVNDVKKEVIDSISLNNAQECQETEQKEE